MKIREEKEGPYEIRKQQLPSGVMETVTTAWSLDAAKQLAEGIAGSQPLWEMFKDGFTWKTINDGTKPDNYQVYQLRTKGGISWTGYEIHGPHVGPDAKKEVNHAGEGDHPDS